MTSAIDVVEVLKPILGTTPPSVIREPAHDRDPKLAQTDDTLRARVQSLLGTAPVSIDDLVREAKTSPATVQNVLLELELAGRLEHLGGGLVSAR